MRSYMLAPGGRPVRASSDCLGRAVDFRTAGAVLPYLCQQVEEERRRKKQPIERLRNCSTVEEEQECVWFEERSNSSSHFLLFYLICGI
jgi:hypothetical protein